MSETETIEHKKTLGPLVIEKEENGIKIVEMKPPSYYPGSDYMRSVVLLDCGGRAGNGFSSDLQKTVKHYREETETETELLVALGKEMNLPAEMTEMDALPDIFLQTVSDADFSMLREVCCARFYSTDSSSFWFTHIDFRHIRHLFSIKKMVERKACAPKILYQKSGSLKEAADSVASKLGKDTRAVLALVVGEVTKEIRNAFESILAALPDDSDLFWTGIPAESQNLADCKLVVLAMQGEKL